MAERTINFTIKSTNGTWSVLDDSTHDNNGCTMVTQTSSYIKVYYNKFKAITSCSIEEDNVLNGMRITAGASVGLSYALISFHKNGVLINPRSITKSTANLFISISGND